MRFIDWFAGIGGFRIGLTKSDHECVWACEIDDFCRKIYAQRFEEPQGKDINDVKAKEIPEAELWCGGFPCQDVSVAGRGKGLKGEKSGVWWAWHKLIQARKPEWLLIENVPGLLTSNGGADFKALLCSIAEVEIPMPRHGKWPDAGLIRGKGMEIAWRILDAQYFGLAQRRRRVFIVRHLGKGSAAEILFECKGVCGNTAQKREAGNEIAASVEGCANNGGALSTPITARAVTTHKRQDRGDHSRSTHIVGTLKHRHDGSPGAGGGSPIVSGFMAGQGAKARSIGYQEEQCPTLKANESGTNRTPYISFAENQRGEVRTSDVSPQLSVGGGKPGQGYGAVIDCADAVNEERGGKQFDAETEMVRTSGEDIRPTTPPHPNGVRETAGIRRRVHTPDSPRYKALGNAVAVPVIEWIGDRLAKHG